MKIHLKKALNSGMIFGIVTILLVMLGMAFTIGGVLADFLKLELFQGVMIFFVLVGVAAGANSAKLEEDDAYWHLILRGAVTGFVSGLFVGALAYLFGSLWFDREIELRGYLPQMSPKNIGDLLFTLSPVQGTLQLIGIITGGSILSAVLIGGFRILRSRRVTQTSVSLRDRLEENNFYRSIADFKYTRIILYGIFVIVIFALPFYIGQYYNFILGTVGIYVLMGLGLNIVIGLAGLLDLGYVAFFAVGAYTVGLLTAPEPLGIMMNFWLALPLGIVFAALAGILLGIPVLRLRGDYLAIVTLGFGEIIRVLAKSDMLADYFGGPRGVRDIRGPQLFGLSLTSSRDYLIMIIIAIILAIFITIRLERSRIGRAWIAMREDETVAQAMGINTLNYKLLAFAIGAAFAGLGGVLFAARNQYSGPEDFNLLVSINVLSLIIVGGMGSIPGVIVGAFTLKGLPEILRQLDDYRILVFGALLVVMMIWRPQGLWPSSRQKLVMKSIEEEEIQIPDIGEATQ